MGFFALLVSFVTILFVWNIFERASNKNLLEKRPVATGTKIPGPSSGAYYGLFLGILSIAIMLGIQSLFCVIPGLIGLGYCLRSIFRGFSLFKRFVLSAFVGCCVNGFALLFAYGLFLEMWQIPEVFELTDLLRATH